MILIINYQVLLSSVSLRLCLNAFRLVLLISSRTLLHNARPMKDKAF